MSNKNIIPFLLSTSSSHLEQGLSNTSNRNNKFNINENRDILVEILKRVDGRTLGVASCVCRLWCDLATTDDTIWEHICFRHVSPPGVRALVLALGGYKRLYMVCVRPVLGVLGQGGAGGNAGRVGRKRARNELEFELTRRVWTRQGAQLLLSLFCVDYYENLGGSNTTSSDSTSSLMFLCKPVNV